MKRPLAGIKVLVVEDDDDGLEMLELFLSSDQGAVVTTARNAAEAREKLATTTPDVLISDLSLPDEDGYALLASVRSSSATSHIPAIALTGYADDASFLRAIKAGFDRRIAKPADLTELASAILALVSQSPDAAPTSSSPRLSSLPESIFALIARGDLHGLIAILNDHAPYRFTSFSRFDGERVVQLAYADRENPNAAPDGDRIAKSYHLYVRDLRAPLVLEDANEDTRVAAAHPVRARAMSYVGLPILRTDGSIFGSICHYDVVRREARDDVVAVLDRVARLLRSELQRYEKSS
jgi:CheY-like chemotaxis protein